MDRVRIGMTYRAVRLKLRLRQQDVATRARVSRATIVRIEHGHVGGMTIDTLEQVANALEIRLDAILRWRGGDLDQMLNAGHARLHELVTRQLTSLGWEVAPEVTFSDYGERGVIDIVAWHAATRTLLIIELKTLLVDMSDLMATMDRRRRLAPRIAATRGWKPAAVATWVVLADTRTNRRRVAAHAAVLRAAFPSDGHSVRGWLRRPRGAMAALSFVTDGQLRSASQGRRRIRVPRTAA
jgi:transcriptional regulator with XRE-family HTH domain